MRLNQQGYTLAGALCLIAVMSIFMALSIPLWQRVKQRENEEELVFRGKEYIESIARYHQRFHTYPADLETLEKQKFIRKLYKDPMTKSGKWKILTPNSVAQVGEAGAINDPGQKKGETPEQKDDAGDGAGNSGFGERTSRDNKNKDGTAESDEEPETETVGPVVGVVSRSKKPSMKIYNGQTTYNKWMFIFAAQQQQPQQPPGSKKPPKGGKNPPKPNQGPKTTPPTTQPPVPDDESD